MGSGAGLRRRKAPSPRAEQVLLRSLQQSRSRFSGGIIGPHQDHASDAQLGGNVVFAVVGPKTSMRPNPTARPLSDGNDQPAAIEIRFAEHQLLKQIGRHRLQQPRLAGTNCAKMSITAGGSVLRKV